MAGRAGIAVLVALVAAAGSPAASSPTVTVRCSDVIRPTGTFEWKPRRVVLGLVDVPPLRLGRPDASGDPRWPYGLKAGLVVRAGSPPVTVEVPARWRGRVAIGWGRVEAASRLRLATCPELTAIEGWNPYAGGFVLRVRAACVPLTFGSGTRRTTVRFGIGKRCT